MLIDGGGALGDRLRQSDRVDDRGVIERVRDHEVVLLDDRRRQTLVRVPRRDVAERCLRADQFGDRLLQVAVNRERSADESDTPRARAELPQPFDTGGNYFGVVRQTEVVVRRKNDNVATALHLHPRVLRRCQIIQPLVDSISLEFLDRSVQIRIESLVERHFNSFVMFAPPPASRLPPPATQPRR